MSSGGWLDKDGKIYLSIYLNLVTWLTQNRTRKHIRDKEFASMPSVPGMSLANSLYYQVESNRHQQLCRHSHYQAANRIRIDEPRL